MNVLKALKRFAIVVPTALLLVAAAGPAARAQVSGALFTTNSDCSGVDLNIYKDKKDVYINGGPRKPGAAGLPPGNYFVQVTDPSGKVLLGVPPKDNKGPIPQVVVDHRGEFVDPATGLGHCYQLWAILRYPNNGRVGYDNTPNRGNEYKVWISKDSSFTNSESKTDNFKVKGQPVTSINGYKFYDYNRNKIWDESDDTEPPIPGWMIRLKNATTKEVLASTLTDGGGRYEFLVPQDGSNYTVEEVMPKEEFNPIDKSGHWIATTDKESSTLEANKNAITVGLVDGKITLFGNVCVTHKPGDGRTRGFWHNKNGLDVMSANINPATNPKVSYGDDALAFIQGHNLIDLDGSPFVPKNLAEFQDWLVGPTVNASTMATMLSSQMIATALNVRYGFLDGDGSVMFADPALADFNGMTVQELINAANKGGGGYSPALLKDALDTLNNTGNDGDAKAYLLIIERKPCLFTYELVAP